MNSGTLAKLVILALILTFSAIPAFAADITVNATCSFADAWTAATSDTATGGCPAGSGADKIILTDDVTLSAGIFYGSGGTIIIEGNGHTISGNDSFGLFSFWGPLTLTLNSVTLTGGNSSTGGGALNPYASSPVININDSVFHGNTATGGNSAHGGAILVGGNATVTINRSVFYNNSAIGSEYNGGAIYAQGNVTITNSSFYNNQATELGGALWLAPVDHRIASLRHVTITGNSASEGGGLYLLKGNAQLRNSIVYGNTGGAAADCKRNTPAGTSILDVNSYNILGSSDCGGTAYSTDDPKLPGIGDGASLIPLVPMSGSPAINAADCLPGVTQDFKGTPRPQGSKCDIGAYEVFFEPPANDDASAGAGASASGDGGGGGRPYIPPTPMPKISPASTCLILGPEIVVSNASAGTSCRLVEPSGYGHQDLFAAMPSSVVDIWGWVTPATQVCFQAQSGGIRFVDTTVSPRTIAALPAFGLNGMVCATIDGAGQVALVPGPAPPAASAPTSTAAETSPMSQSLSNCMVRLKYSLNFRDAPAGKRIGGIRHNAVLTALERTVGWFKVDYHGERGWIAAMYVEPIGACG